MKILVIGSGGREHAIAWKLSQSRHAKEIFCAPGNPGTEAVAQNVEISANDFPDVREFCKSKAIDLVVIGPETPLVAGLADVLVEDRFRVVGPYQAGAQLEGSKVFAKEFMKRHGIPTAHFHVYDDPSAAREYIGGLGKPIVIKADGLAAGKGVTLPKDVTEARIAIDRIMVAKEFGDAGDRILIEDRLEGEEASLLVLLDGKSALPLAPAQDHKRAFDNDAGPNTGGMGAYSPAPIVTEAVMGRVQKEIIDRVRTGLQKEKLEYRGVLYIGLMLTKDGPKVLEFNVRFGDPETQAILPRLKGDFAELMLATAEGSLADVHIDWTHEWAVCVVLASGGYPGKFERGLPIDGIREAGELRGISIFHAGTAWGNKKLVTAGGRVLNVVALGETAPTAIHRAYEAIAHLHFDKMHYRMDIGKRALLEVNS